MDMNNENQDDEESFQHENFQEPELLGAFMVSLMSADIAYRQNYCDLIAQKVYNEFGIDGMCELMISLDRRAEWISDIIIDSPDLDNIAFKKYGVYDPQMSRKARETKAIQELNTKLWRLRRKYAKLIVDEIMEQDAQA